MTAALDALLAPRSIAVVGASPRPGSFGASLTAAIGSLATPVRSTW